LIVQVLFFDRQAHMKQLLIIIVLGMVLYVSCSTNEPSILGPAEGKKALEIQAEVSKWFDGHQAAVSINYDGPYGTHEKINRVADDVTGRGLHMDYECVTDSYSRESYQQIVIDMRTIMIPRGVHFFGHGHKHDQHDWFDFDYCYTSFKTCYDYMELWGLQPKAYGYPASSGRNKTTQLACELAGFISARGVTVYPDSFFICPDELTEPLNWYYLPSVPVGKNYPSYVNDHSEMSVVLDRNLEKTAWIIIMYHAIDFPDGWGYYPRADFLQDLDQIAANDFWSGNMDMVAAYIHERNRFQLDVSTVMVKDDTWYCDIVFRDGLDNTMYNQPLTVELTFATEYTIQNVYIEPPLNLLSVFPVTDNKLIVNIIPDERVYHLKIKR